MDKAITTAPSTALSCSRFRAPRGPCSGRFLPPVSHKARNKAALSSFAPESPDYSLAGGAGSDLWAQGIVDCEDTSCGLVPDGAVVLVPHGKQPSKIEDRIAMLEAGSELREETPTFVGAVREQGVNFVVHSLAVSGKHARIESVVEDNQSSLKKMFGFSVDKKYFLTDLNSENGTFVNRGKLRPLYPVEVKPGDVLAFGSLDNSFRVVRAQARKGFVW